MSPEPLSYAAAFLLGLLGSTHCIGMCGGIMGALTLAVPPAARRPAKLLPILLGYNLGRMLSYGLLGALAGALAWLLAEQMLHIGFLLRWLAGLLLIAMGAYLAGWWSVLRYLERAGSHLWRRLQPLLRRFTPIDNPARALAVGLLWGYLPCGLIYSTLAWAATSADWRQSALLMLSFGAGTLPAVMATGLLLERLQWLVRARGLRLAAALAVILFGLWTLPLGHGTGTTNHQHVGFGDSLLNFRGFSAPLLSSQLSQLTAVKLGS